MIQFLVFLIVFLLSKLFVSAQPHLPVITVQARGHFERQANFTQGLVFYRQGNDHFLYESVGLYGLLKIIKRDLHSSHIVQRFSLSPSTGENYFAEGMTIFDQRLFQLTWKTGTVLVYDLDLNFISQFQYQGEGWGLTHDKNHLIRSDGSSNLYFHDRKNFSNLRTLSVTLAGKPVQNLNALQYVEGFVLANVWKEDYLLGIRVDTGQVNFLVDCSPIVRDYFTSYPLEKNQEQVLNGIAYQDFTQEFYLTGKNWKRVYLVRLPFRLKNHSFSTGKP